MAKKIENVPVGATVRVESKGVEGVVSWTSSYERMFRLEGGGTTQFYAWDEADILAPPAAAADAAADAQGPQSRKGKA